MTIHRPIQIVEIDVKRCPLVYGEGPCQAVLGTTGNHKCFNTFATCQHTRAFGQAVEPTADRTYADQDAIDAADFDRSGDFAFACDVVITSGPTGCIWEVGGPLIGLYLGFTNGELVFRVGDGGSGTPSGCAKLTADAADFEGKTGTFYGSVDMSAGAASLWFFDSANQTLTAVGTATDTFAFWGGLTAGKFGGADGPPTDEDATDFNGTAETLRVFDSTTLEPTLDGNLTTLRYSQNVDGLPLSPMVFPALSGPVKTQPIKINFGGHSRDRLGSLGRRARITIPFADFQGGDRYFDRYFDERVSGAAQADGVGYNPDTRGTHFLKLYARFPYFNGSNIRILDGEVGDALDDMTTRHFVGDVMNGPNASGAGGITAKDVLDFAGNEKAKCPVATSGALSEDVDSSFLGDVTLTPEGIGASYDASGKVRIGGEILSFTRSGDVLTITARGQGGTDAEDHSEGDTAQQCYEVVKRRLDLVLYDLLVNFAKVPAEFIDADAWEAETLRWLAGFNLDRIITAPKGVQDLISQICELGVFLWWDEEQQKIRLRANRPIDLDEAAASMTEGANILAGTLVRKAEEDRRLTGVIFVHGLRNYAKDGDNADNYLFAHTDFDLEARSAKEFNRDRIREIYCPWLGAGRQSVARVVVNRLLSRFRETPVTVTFDIESKDAANCRPASILSVASRLLQDATGLSEGTSKQVSEVEPLGQNRLRVTAEAYTFDGVYGFICADSVPDYDSATETQKDEGLFICADDETEFSDGRPVYTFF